MANRLWRVHTDYGAVEEILPPLGYAYRPTGPAVPGSAILLSGAYTYGQQAWVDGQPWPTSDVNPGGLWVQVPWEWSAATVQELVTRTQGNPFECVMQIAFAGTYAPDFPAIADTNSPNGTNVR